MEIYLIRHTPPKVEPGICYGQTDLPVDDIFFIPDAEKIKKKIPKKIDAVFSSPLARCKDLAENISRSFHLPAAVIDDRLMEFNFGKWEMSEWENIDRNEFKEWEADIINYSVPEGESLTALKNRVSSFIDDMCKSKNKNILIVTHAGVIRCFIAILENISLTDAFQISVEFSSVRRIQII